MLSLFHGTVDISAYEVIMTLFNPKNNDTSSLIILQSRLPMAITALLCGAILSLSGLILQTIFSNPLADPSILGVSSGASLGVAIVMILLGGSFAYNTFTLSGFSLVILSATIGALLVIALMLFLSNYLRNSLMLLIVGIMTSYLISSIITLLNYHASAEGLQTFIIWGMGDFSSIGIKELGFFSVISIIMILLVFTLIKPLNALLLNEHYAKNLGVSIHSARNKMLLTSGILVAICTAMCGPISFIGLAVPHIARFIFKTSNHRVLIPATLLCGSAICLLCNILCTLSPSLGILPINIITPFIGIPVIIYILLKRAQ